MKDVFAAVGVIVTIVLLIAGVVLFGLAINAGLNANDQAECLHWQAQAKALAPFSSSTPGGFYITKDEKDQCDYWHIDTGAVVNDQQS